MPAAALYRPSSMGLLKLEPGFRVAVQPVLNDSRLVDRPPGRELEGKPPDPWTGGRRAERRLQRADLVRRLLERRVDGRDDLLAGLEGAQRGDHVGHRLHGVGARALERAGAHLAGAAATGRALEEVVAGLARVVDGEDADRAGGDLAVGTERDRLVVLVEDRVAELVGEAAVGGGGELAVARVAHAPRSLHREV